MLNNIQIKLNLMSSIHKQGIYPHISLRSGAQWSVDINTQILIFLRAHINAEMVKVGVEKAISVFLIFFYSVLPFHNNSYWSFPVLFCVYHLLNFICKIISTQNLVVSLSDILASYCFSPLFSYLSRLDHVFVSVWNWSFNSLQWHHKTFCAEEAKENPVL